MLLLLTTLCLAGDGWFRAPATAEIDGVVDVPLYRSAADPRPQLSATVGERELFAVVDLAGSWTRVGWGPVIGAGLKTRDVDGQSGRQTRVVLPEVRIGELVLRNVHAQVVVGEELVIGMSAIPTLEAAILPSQGVIRFATAGSAIAVGRGQIRDPQPLGPYWELGELRHGDGLTARVSGLMQSPEPTKGVVHLRTDRPDTVLGSAVPTSEAHAGMRTAEARFRMGEITTPEVIGRVDQRIGDPDPQWIGALGYDALYALDLAVGPEEITWNWAQRVLWVDIPDTEDRLAKAEDEIGDGDQCMPWLVLGMRRQRAGHEGALLALEEGMALYEAWAALDRKTRDKVRAGRKIDDAVEQHAGCGQATGRWLLARLAEGADPAEIAELAAQTDDGLNDWIPLAGALAHLRQGENGPAEGLLRTAYGRAGGREVWLALAVVNAQAGRTEAAVALLDRVSWEDPNPLLTAWVRWRLGLLPEARYGPSPSALAERVVRAAADGSVPERLVRDLESARQQTAGAAWVLAAQRVLARTAGVDPGPLELALGPYEDRSPDTWVARLQDPDPDVASVAHAVIRARFPEWAIPPLPEENP